MPQNNLKYAAYRQYHLPVILMRYPVRFCIWLVFMILFFHDLHAVFAPFISGHALLSGVVLILLSIGIFFGLPALCEYIEYKRFPARFYDDRLELRDSLLLNENLKVPYRNVTSVKKHANPLQKMYGIETICIELSSGYSSDKSRDFKFKLHDLKQGDRIEKLLGA